MKPFTLILSVVGIVAAVTAVVLVASFLLTRESDDGGSQDYRPVTEEMTEQAPDALPVEGKSFTLRLSAGESGTLKHESGAVVEIPSGALKESVTVSISEVEPPGPELPEIVSLGRVFDISIGQAKLAKPISIRIPYERKAGTTAEEVLPLHWDDVANAWEVLEGEVDDVRGEVKVEVSELSWFTTIVRDLSGLYDYSSEDAWMQSCEAGPQEVGSTKEFTVSATVMNRSVQDRMYVEIVVKDGVRGLEWNLESASANVVLGETGEFRAAERLSPPGAHIFQCVLRVGLPGREEIDVAFPTSLSDLNDLISAWFGPELDRSEEYELRVGEFTKSGRTEAQLSECSAEETADGAIALRATPFRMEKVGQYKYFKMAFTVYKNGEQVYGHEPEEIGYLSDDFSSLDGGWETTFLPETSGQYTLDCVLVGDIHLFGEKHAILKVAEAIQDPLVMGGILDEWTRAANSGLQWYSSTEFYWDASTEDERKGFGQVEPMPLAQDPAADEFPVWSLDGQHIAFSSDRDGDYDIYLMSADGSNLTQLTDDPAADTHPSWSPDGRRIAYVSLDRRHLGEYTHDLRAMNADGTNDVALIARSDDVLRSPVWSPNGQYIAFNEDNAGRIPQIAVFDLNSRSAETLTSLFKAENPLWSPDRQHILFEAIDRSKLYSSIPEQSDVFVIDADGSTLANLTDDDGWDRSPSWSPDGRRIAFSSDRNGEYDIYVMNANGSAVTQLTDAPGRDFLPSWAPDGQRIAFLSTRDGDSGIYIMDSDGSNQTLLSDSPGNIGLLNWSPDGQRIVFSAFSSDTGSDIYLINLDEVGRNSER